MEGLGCGLTMPGTRVSCRGGSRTALKVVLASAAHFGRPPAPSVRQCQLSTHSARILTIQRPLTRVVGNVLPNARQIAFAAHDVLVIVPLPYDRTWRPTQFIDALGRDCLESSDQAAQRFALPGRLADGQDAVQVIGHQHPGVQCDVQVLRSLLPGDRPASGAPHRPLPFQRSWSDPLCTASQSMPRSRGSPSREDGQSADGARDRTKVGNGPSRVSPGVPRRGAITDSERSARVQT